MTKSAIDKMVGILEQETKETPQDWDDSARYSGLLWALEEARRLAAEEAKEKPVGDEAQKRYYNECASNSVLYDLAGALIDELEKWDPGTPFLEKAEAQLEGNGYSLGRPVNDDDLTAAYMKGLADGKGKPPAPASLVEPTRWHDLKVVSPHWEALRSNVKPFEIRKNDRDYKVGDGLELRHWADGEYVVNEAPQYFVVTSMTDFPDGIKPGYVVMGISRYRPAPQADIVGELVKVLKYLDACGGLGYEKHEMIRTALLKYEEGR